MSKAAGPAGDWAVVGHEACVATLRGALERGEVSHAYLFTGPAGAGKSTLARALALALVCTPPSGSPAPCRACAQCRLALAGAHPDVTTLVRDAERQVITTAQLKSFESRIALLPYQAPRSVYIVEDADRLHEAAANALLKTLEEPPPHAVLVLTAADEEAVPATVRSRCQVLALRPVPAPRIARWLEEVHGVPGLQARTLAALSGGRPGWALSAAAAPAVLAEHEARLERVAGLLDLAPTARVAAVPRLLDRPTFNENRELAAEVLDVLLQWTRDLLMIVEGLPNLVVATRHFERLEIQAGRLSRESLRRSVGLIRQAMLDVERNVTPRLVLETLLLQLPAAQPVGGRR